MPLTLGQRLNVSWLNTLLFTGFKISNDASLRLSLRDVCALSAALSAEIRAQLEMHEPRVCHNGAGGDRRSPSSCAVGGAVCGGGGSRCAMVREALAKFRRCAARLRTIDAAAPDEFVRQATELADQLKTHLANMQAEDDKVGVAGACTGLSPPPPPPLVTSNGIWIIVARYAGN